MISMDDKYNKMVLSVIIPVYKVEAYISKCIDSILEQTYQNFELIIVDDGSPDQCGSICDAYAEADPRVRVYHKENGGHYEAENYGLQYSSGDYIYFVDGDDYIENKESFRLLLKEAADTDADIVTGNYHKDINGELIPTKPHSLFSETDTSTVDFRFNSFFSIGHLAYTWCKIYKRSFLVKHELVMKPYLYSQDKLFNIECYLKRPSYSFISDSVYVYRYHSSSISHQYKENFSDIWIGIMEELCSDLNMIKNGNLYLDFNIFQLFFAIFFSCKQEFIYHGHRLKVIKMELEKYARNSLVQRILKENWKSKDISSLSSTMWKLMIRSFFFAFKLRFYTMLALGIKLIIGFDIDAKLSSIERKPTSI